MTGPTGTTAGSEPPVSAAHPAAASAAPSAQPTQRQVVARAALLVAIGVVVFGVILPRVVDVNQVWATLATLTSTQLLALSAATLLAYIANAGPAKLLVPGLSWPHAIGSDLAGRAVASADPRSHRRCHPVRALPPVADPGGCRDLGDRGRRDVRDPVCARAAGDRRGRRRSCPATTCDPTRYCYRSPASRSSSSPSRSLERSSGRSPSRGRLGELLQRIADRLWSLCPPDAANGRRRFWCSTSGRASARRSTGTVPSRTSRRSWRTARLVRRARGGPLVGGRSRPRCCLRPQCSRRWRPLPWFRSSRSRPARWA